MCVCIYVYIYICIHIHILIHMYMCIYTYVYIGLTPRVVSFLFQEDGSEDDLSYIKLINYGQKVYMA